VLDKPNKYISAGLSQSGKMKIVPDVAVQQLLNLLPMCRQLLHSHSL